MPNQPPLDRTRATGVPPVFNRGLSAGNPPTTQKMRNEPNLPPANSQIRKTNPISPTLRPACRKRKETNPIDTPACHPERRAAERSAAAQSRATCQNNIAEGDSNQTNPAHTPKMQNEPNLSPTSPKKTKRTQFTAQAGNLPYGHGMPCPNSTRPTAKSKQPTAKKTKRTQFQPRSPPGRALLYHLLIAIAQNLPGCFGDVVVGREHRDYLLEIPIAFDFGKCRRKIQIVHPRQVYQLHVDVRL